MISYALTFDDGPGSATESILDLLKKYKVRATFFILGQNIEEAKWCKGNTKHAMMILHRAIKEGHIIGNHTYSHSPKINSKKLISDINYCDALIKKAYLKSSVKLTSPIPFRLPYGIYAQSFKKGFCKTGENLKMLDPRIYAIASIGKSHLHWTGSFSDWKLYEEQDGLILFHRMKNHVVELSKKNLKSVLDLHDGNSPANKNTIANRSATLIGLQHFLEYAKNHNWKSFVVPTV